eukprot:TRINITY_DN7931_c0_g1_i1.p1 TRINITY_DN7931_c0_g1~~TRINITY_DN7931_c0_g1_i1.p1  ORF type:complete len:129 (+),score=14.12 TRINITY_DN7931_c0_g1_i1:90-476(+)
MAGFLAGIVDRSSVRGEDDGQAPLSMAKPREDSKVSNPELLGLPVPMAGRAVITRRDRFALCTSTSGTSGFVRQTNALKLSRARLTSVGRQRQVAATFVGGKREACMWAPKDGSPRLQFKVTARDRHD